MNFDQDSSSISEANCDTLLEAKEMMVLKTKAPFQPSLLAPLRQFSYEYEIIWDYVSVFQSLYTRNNVFWECRHIPLHSRWQIHVHFLVRKRPRCACFEVACYCRRVCKFWDERRQVQKMVLVGCPHFAQLPSPSFLHGWGKKSPYR